MCNKVYNNIGILIQTLGFFFHLIREEEEELGFRGGPGGNEVSFRARLHHNVHSTLEVDIGVIGP